MLIAHQCQQVKESSFEFYHAKAQRREGRKGEEGEVVVRLIFDEQDESYSITIILTYNTRRAHARLKSCCRCCPLWLLLRAVTIHIYSKNTPQRGAVIRLPFLLPSRPLP